MAVGRVNEGRRVILTLVSRPFLGTRCEAGEQRSRVSPSAAEGRRQSLVYRVFIYCESCCPEKPDSGPGPSGLHLATLQGWGHQGASHSCPVFPWFRVLRRQEVALPPQLRVIVAASPPQLRVSAVAAPAQHTAGSGACALHSCPQLPHSVEGTPQRPQKVQHRPGGSDG